MVCRWLVAGSGGVLAAVDDGGVGAEGPVRVVEVGVQAQSFGGASPGAVEGPAAFVLVDGLLVVEAGGRVASGDAGAFAEQDAGDDGAVVTPAAAAGWVLRQQWREQSPLGVGGFESCVHGASMNIETYQDLPARSTTRGLSPGMKPGALEAASR